MRVCVHRASYLLALAGLLTAPAASGCAQYERYNSVAVVDWKPRAHHDPAWWCCLKSCYFYPVRDLATARWLGRAFGTRGKALDLTASGDVPAGSFYQPRDLAKVPPERFETGPWSEPPPKPPFRFLRRKHGSTHGFLGRDATGRRFLFKFDRRRWPELGTAAEAIASRIFWAMGYHVPPCYVVTVEGTGRARYDGRRAVAVKFVPGKVLGHWKFDWFRDRREIRALKILCMWVNDIDHGDDNTLVTWDGSTATYWLIDFNSALGSWQGKPKEPQMGWLHVWDPQWQLAGLLTFGLLRPPYEPNQPIVSPAVGRFDDRLDPTFWRPRQPNSAFASMTDEDAAWMVRKMLSLSDAQLRAIIHSARYRDRRDAEYVYRTLKRRRRILAERYLAAAVSRDSRAAARCAHAGRIARTRLRPEQARAPAKST